MNFGHNILKELFLSSFVLSYIFLEKVVVSLMARPEFIGKYRGYFYRSNLLLSYSSRATYYFIKIQNHSQHFFFLVATCCLRVS